MVVHMARKPENDIGIAFEKFTNFFLECGFADSVRDISIEEIL
jgi:hypothetical protein